MNTTALIIRPAGTDTATIPELALKLKEDALELSAMVGIVNDQDTKEKAVRACIELKGLILGTEKQRKAIKDPVLDLGRKIDACAAEYVSELKKEEVRVNTLIGNYDQEQLEIAREAERARQRELDRIENERREAEYQARKKQEDEERARKQAEEAAEKAKRDAEEAARKAQEAVATANGAAAKRKAQEEAAAKQREAEIAAKAEAESRKKLELERQQAEQARIAEQQAIVERQAQAEEMVGGPVVPTRVSGQTVKVQMDFEVVDKYALARTMPHLVDITPRRADILNLINRDGVKEVKGLRIFESVKSSVSARGQKPIDV